ncbi:MAG: hypothetical protein ABI597_08585 [Gammaproteobacteria bacterium]
MRGLDKRIERLENKLIPRLTHLVVMTKQGEKKEAALKRVMLEQGISELPKDCFLIILNLHKSS